jgi:hypothetical protein
MHELSLQMARAPASFTAWHPRRLAPQQLTTVQLPFVRASGLLRIDEHRHVTHYGL